MSKLREIIRDDRRRRHGLARGPLVWMWIIWEPVLSPTGSVVGKRQTTARMLCVARDHNGQQLAYV
jgi:hypothetical protein